MKVKLLSKKKPKALPKKRPNYEVERLIRESEYYRQFQMSTPKEGDYIEY